MSRLDIAERRIPQDGRISLTIGGRTLDVRVSTLPAKAGERVVLRLLDRDARACTWTISACRRRSRTPSAQP